jgi:hypothetical protein
VTIMAGAETKAEITAIKALLFDDRSRELSKDVLSQSAPDIPELENITTRSHSTLVMKSAVRRGDSRLQRH